MHKHKGFANKLLLQVSRPQFAPNRPPALLALATITETAHEAAKLSRERRASAERAWTALPCP